MSTLLTLNFQLTDRLCGH